MKERRKNIQKTKRRGREEKTYKSKKKMERKRGHWKR
jgi:hypothetical protein